MVLQVRICRDRISELRSEGSSKVKGHRLGLTARRVSRLVLGSALLLSILSANVPSALVASGPLCKLACCAGRAPHAAGSCMNGSCQVSLSGRQKATHSHHEWPAWQAEQFCGLPKLSARVSLLSGHLAALHHSASGTDAEDSPEGQASQNAPARLSLSVSSLGRPCQPDCGGGTISSSNQRRPRESATHSFADRARRPSNPGSLAAANNVIYTRDAIRWQVKPRAPPALRF